MALEIERKFLVVTDEWRYNAQGERVEGVRFRQGYILTDEVTVRVRLEGARGVLTIKARTDGLARLEYEYEIPSTDALEMLEKVCSQPQVDKVRYRVRVGAHEWEVDEFLGDNAGLLMAEIELTREDEVFEKPAWAGEEVTEDTRYLNVNLAKQPYKDWGA